MPSITEQISTLIRARYPIIYLLTYEEARVVGVLREICRVGRRNCYLWSETMGLVPAQADMSVVTPDKATRDPMMALETIRTIKEQAIFILEDFHPYLSERASNRSAGVRKLRDLLEQLKASRKTIIMVSPVLELPTELEKDVVVIDFPLPALEDLDLLLANVIENVKRANKLDLTPSTADREQILKAALGLTLNEADNVFAKCVVTKQRFDTNLVIEEKEQLIRKSGLLEYYHTALGMGDIGGLDLLKEWLVQRRGAFSQKAKDYGLPAPRGLLLTGVQGCGKSLAAKAVANLWGMPLLRLDVGRLFSGFIGSSEDNMRRAIKVAESIAPAVLWIDEIEKAMSGIKSSDSVDSGVTARVFSTLLTWMQEKSAPVFIVATANDIASLPPELLRKGRLDEVFFVDLPGQSEREEIFRIHLLKRQRNPKLFDLPQIAANADGFSGSEMEQVVIAALYSAYALNRDITTADMLAALAETVPISITAEESITALRRWSVMRARPSSSDQREKIAELKREMEGGGQQLDTPRRGNQFAALAGKRRRKIR